jgi:hypothetical protein
VQQGSATRQRRWATSFSFRAQHNRSGSHGGQATGGPHNVIFCFRHSLRKLRVSIINYSITPKAFQSPTSVCHGPPTLVLQSFSLASVVTLFIFSFTWYFILGGEFAHWACNTRLGWLAAWHHDRVDIFFPPRPQISMRHHVFSNSREADRLRVE